MLFPLQVYNHTSWGWNFRWPFGNFPHPKLRSCGGLTQIRRRGLWCRERKIGKRNTEKVLWFVGDGGSRGGGWKKDKEGKGK